MRHQRKHAGNGKADYEGIGGTEAARELHQLAVAILRQAVANLISNVPPEIPKQCIVLAHTCTGHTAGCDCQRCAWDFFSNHLEQPPIPCNFVYCCSILGLRPEAVVEALRRQMPHLRDMEEP